MMDLSCRICGHNTSERWKLKVLDERFEARYMECSYCSCLQIPDPAWLNIAYADEVRLGSALDSGRFRRNYSAFLYLLALESARLFGENSRFLDFGGGTGLLTQMLLNAGKDAWQTDHHIEAPTFAAERRVDLRTLEPQIFEVVTSFEVFEHLIDPMDTALILNRLLKPSGTRLKNTVHGLLAY